MDTASNDAPKCRSELITERIRALTDFLQAMSPGIGMRCESAHGDDVELPASVVLAREDAVKSAFHAVESLAFGTAEEFKAG